MRLWSDQRLVFFISSGHQRRLQILQRVIKEMQVIHLARHRVAEYFDVYTGNIRDKHCEKI